MVDGPTLANWYDLLSRVVSDLQTERAKRRRARLASLSSLFQLIKTVHADYVGIFVSLKEACIRSRSAEAMAAAKESFFQARSQHAGDRRVLYFDAQALREVHDASESLEEKRFIAAVENYLSAYEAPMDAFGLCEEDFQRLGFLADRSSTLSGMVWSRIEDSDNSEQISEVVDRTLHWLGRSYAAIVVAYSSLGGRSSLLASETDPEDAHRRRTDGRADD